MGINRFISGTYTDRRGSLLDQFCGDLNWNIDERHGKGIALYFKGDAISPRRTMIVIHGQGDKLVMFNCYSSATFTNRTLPDKLMPAILLRNDDVPIGGWVASIDDGEVNFCLRHTALAAGMEAADFKMIVSMMIEEVRSLEAGFRSKGLM